MFEKVLQCFQGSHLNNDKEHDDDDGDDGDYDDDGGNGGGGDDEDDDNCPLKLSYHIFGQLLFISLHKKC